MYLYEIVNTETPDVYVGIARKSIRSRWAAHKAASKKYNWAVYALMRQHGIDKFSCVEIARFENEQELLAAEKDRILFRRKEGNCLNVLDGGEPYFPIKDKEQWKAKLREKRKGRKPALGMKHSEENKKFFSECSKKRWDTHGRYPDVSTLSFKEAKEKLGISKTHYYRLKRGKNSELA